MSVSLAVSGVTGGANSCLGACGGAAFAICAFLVSVVVRTDSCMCTVTVGCPSAKGVCAVGGDRQLTLCFNVLFLIKESGANGALVVCLFAFDRAVGLGCGNQIAKRVCCCDSALACLPSNEIGNFICAFLFGVDVTAGALIVILPTVGCAGSCLTVDLFAISVSVRSGAVVVTSITDHIGYVIVNVCALLILFAAFASLPVGAVILDPIAPDVRGCGNDQRCLLYGIFICIKVFVANCAMVMRLHTCQQFILGVRCGNCLDLVAVVVCGKITGFGTAYRAGCFLCTGCFAIIVRLQFACFCATYGASCLLCAGRFAVIVRLQFAGFGTTYGAGSLLCAGRFAIIVRLEVTCFVATDGAGSLLCAGRFTVIVSVGLAISGVTSGANCRLGAGSGAACASNGLLVLVVVRADSCVRTVAVGCPSTVGVFAVGCNGKLLGASYVAFHIEQSAANRALAVLLHTLFGTVSLYCRDGVAQRMCCRDFALACLPINKAGNFVCAILVGVNVTAGALIVVFPTVGGAGCCLTVYLFTVSVGVRSGAIVATSVTDHIGFIVVNVLAKLILLAAFASLPVVVVILDPFTVGVSGRGDDEIFIINGVFALVEILCAKAALEVCLNTLGEGILGVGGGNLLDLDAIAVCAKVAVSSFASGTNCLCNAGCGSALASSGFLVRVVTRADSGVRAVAIGCPIAKAVRIVDSDGQCLLGGSVEACIKECMAYRALVMRLHTRLSTVCILLRNIIAIGVRDIASMSAIVTCGVTGVIPCVLYLILDAALFVGASGIGAFVPMVCSIGLIGIIVGVRVIDRTNFNGLFANVEVCALERGRRIQSNVAADNLPMREALACGNFTHFQLYIEAVDLCGDRVAACIKCRSSLNGDGNGNLEQRVLTTC